MPLQTRLGKVIVNTTRRVFVQWLGMLAAWSSFGQDKQQRLPIAFSTLGCPAWNFAKILDFADTQCGFKAFNMVKFRPLLDLMTIDRFGFDVEFLFVAQFNRLRLAEIPVRWNDVAGSKVSAFRDARRMITELQQIRRNTRRGLYNIAK